MVIFTLDVSILQFLNHDIVCPFIEFTEFINLHIKRIFVRD